MKYYWQRFLRWLDGKEKNGPDKIRVAFPKGNTDILLSSNQRRNLENAMNGPSEAESTSFYSRDTGFYRRGGSAGGRKEDLII